MYKHFIVVDDDTTNNLICKYLITKACPGSIVNVFTDPGGALATIRETFDTVRTAEPTVLFLDINMPYMSGWEFLAIFQTFDPHITSNFTIFLLSSSIDQRDKQRAEASQMAHGFVLKPLTADMITQLLDNLAQ